VGIRPSLRSALGDSKLRGRRINMLDIGLGIVAAVVFVVYLIYALLRAERF
jgi:K+-transporting ATPase KdpF subunit